MVKRDSNRHYAYRDAAPDRPLEVGHVAIEDGANLAEDDHVLALIGFGARAQRNLDRPAQLSIGLPALGASRGLAEVWRGAAPARTVICDEVVLRVAGDIAFGHVLLDEAEHGGLQHATFAAYRGILRAVQAHGCEHLLRVWHYFPDIHGIERGIERYQAFCVGRHQALSGDADFERTLPAATAIGGSAPGLLIYFIAATAPGRQIENPRQVSAFRYPRRYGPKSPSFSRAVHRRAGDGDTLFVSGTASVRGHRSQHPGDVQAQLAETLDNVRIVVGQAGDAGGGPLRYPQDLQQLKIYLRNAADYPAVAASLRARLGVTVPTVFLHGDVCRSDLLLEIEAVCSTGVL